TDGLHHEARAPGRDPRPGCLAPQARAVDERPAERRAFFVPGLLTKRRRAHRERVERRVAGKRPTPTPVRTVTPCPGFPSDHDAKRVADGHRARSRDSLTCACSRTAPRARLA